MSHQHELPFGDLLTVPELGTPSKPAFSSPDQVLLFHMNENMASMLREMSSTREAVTKLREDMSAMKERQSAHYETKDDVKALTERVTKLEARRHQQDGAMGLADWVRQFGPWLLGIAASAFVLVKTGSITP